VNFRGKRRMFELKTWNLTNCLRGKFNHLRDQGREFRADNSINSGDIWSFRDPQVEKELPGRRSGHLERMTTY